MSSIAARSLRSLPVVRSTFTLFGRNGTSAPAFLHVPGVEHGCVMHNLRASPDTTGVVQRRQGGGVSMDALTSILNIPRAHVHGGGGAADSDQMLAEKLAEIVAMNRNARRPKKGFSPPLARRRSNCPPPSPNLVRTHPIEYYQALRDSAPCLSRAATLPKGINLELGEVRAWEHRLSQPYRRHVSTDSLNREASQLAASLEGKPGPTPAGKSLSHSYPETRFRRHKARG